MGPPEDVVIKIASHFGIDTFVETGTYKAATAVWASKHFEQVFTIEAAQPFYQEAVKLYSYIEHIHFIHGHSTESLCTLVDAFEQESRRATFWLDAHWSGGETYGEQDECPLLEELKIILGS